MKKYILPFLLAAACIHAENPVVIMKTNHGNIKIKLDAEKAPKTVANFLSYVKDGFYTNTVFHRIVPGFVIQGGGFAKGQDHKHEQKQVKPPVVNEASNGLHNALGTISMARTSNPDSGTSQFFLNTADNTNKLDPGKADAAGYAVFGEIIEGLEVAKKIEALETTTQSLITLHGEAPMQSVPKEDAIIMEVTLETPAKADKEAKEEKPAAEKTEKTK